MFTDDDAGQFALKKLYPLIGRIWPGERVVLGLRTNKWLHLQLISKAEEIVLKRKPGRCFTEVDPGVYADDLCRFSSGNISITAAAAKNLASALLTAIPQRLCNTLVKLELRLTVLSPELAAMLGTCGALTHLELADNNMSAQHVEAFAPALARCCNLRDLRLKNNPIGEAGADFLEKPLRDCRMLESVELMGCIMASGVSSTQQVQLQGFSRGLQACARLQRLNLTACHMGDVAATGLSTALAQLPYLTILNLGLNALSAAGARALGQTLGSCSRLTALSVEHNHVEDAGLVALCEALQPCTALQTLSCYRAAIGDTGGARVASLLASHPRLTSVNLAQNELSDAAAELLAGAVARHASLSNLNLEGNKIGDAGARRLGEAVRGKPPGALKLWLRGNELSEATQAELAPTLGDACVFGIRLLLS